MLTNIFSLLIGYNGVIKNTVTFRERLPFGQLGQLGQTVLNMTEAISKEYADKKRVILMARPITKYDWKKAARWAGNRQIGHIKGSDANTFIVPSTEALEEKWILSNDKVAHLENMQSNDFDQYVSFGSGLYWKVQLSRDDWKSKSFCTCPYFLKNFIFKHVIGMGLRLKLCRCPRNADPTTIGPKANASA